MPPKTVMTSPARKGSSACGETKRQLSGPGRPCHHPHWLGSLRRSSPPHPHWGSSPGGCSQTQPPWSGELSGWQRGPAQGGLQGKGRFGTFSGLPYPTPPLHWRPAGPLFPTSPTSCSYRGETRGTARPTPFPSLPYPEIAPHLHSAGQDLLTQLRRECAREPPTLTPHPCSGGTGQAGCSASH